LVLIVFRYNPLALSLSKGEVSVPLWFDRLTMSGG